MSMIISAIVSRDIIIKLLGWHDSLFCLNLVKQPSVCHMEQCLSQKTVFDWATGNKAHEPKLQNVANDQSESSIPEQCNKEERIKKDVKNLQMILPWRSWQIPGRSDIPLPMKKKKCF